ncbi:MAG: hypothetical protein M3Y51_11680 [Actinomycetota bacterium]|nr:hypothetical protein [Actinomycetota bacterium]
MSSSDTAQAVAGPFGDLGGRFMLSGRTYATGNDLGFEGMDFYFTGRGGVLGPVDASVVAHEFGFFPFDRLSELWSAGCAVMAPEDAAAAFLECGYAWGRVRLPEGLDHARLAELVRRVTDSAVDGPVGGPALSSAWNRVPWPDDERDAALHAIHLMRELRGGAHVAAVHAAGFDPHLAVMVNNGAAGAEFFGWPEPHPDPEPAREQWHRVEVATNDAVAARLDVLDDDEQAELIALAHAAVPT